MIAQIRWRAQGQMSQRGCGNPDAGLGLRVPVIFQNAAHSIRLKVDSDRIADPFFKISVLVKTNILKRGRPKAVANALTIPS